MADQVNQTREEILAILNGPHKYENGRYVSTVKTPQQIADEEFEKNQAAVKADLKKVLDKKG